jgi:hypothetical protein
MGEASGILKSTKIMRVSGKNVELPSRTLYSMCEDLSLEGHITTDLAYSEIDKSFLDSGKELYTTCECLSLKINR